MNKKNLENFWLIDQAKFLYFNGKYEEAYFNFQKLAIDDNPEVLFYLGNMLIDGLGVQVNKQEAKEYFQKSASLGYLPSKYRLRQFDNKDISFYTRKTSDLNLLISDSKELDLKTVNKEFLLDKKSQLKKELEIQDDMNAMYEYACVFLNYVVPDYEKSAYWFQASAAKGCVDAYYQLSKLYKKGLGVPKDIEKAFLYLKQAQEQGHLESSFDLATIYCDKNSKFFNLDLGIALLEQIKEEVPKASIFLARLYLSDIFGKPNKSKAKHYLKLVKNIKDDETSVLLANLLLEDKKYEEALKLLNEAANNYNALAVYLLATLYEKGTGVLSLEDKAAFLYNLAAEMGHTKAQYNFALICRKQNSKKIHSISNYWLYKAANKGDLEACYEYGLFLKKQIDDLLKSSKQPSFKDSEHKVCWSLNNETKPYFAEYKECFDYLIKAAEAGIKGAECLISQMYLHGDGVCINYSEAIKWYTRAAEHGCSQSQFNLAQIYEKGEFVTSNLEEAIKWYTLAADNGSYEAMYSLGNIYMQGTFLPQNYKKSFEFYKTAHENSYQLATCKLGIHYLKGLGVQQDLDRAEKLFVLSAKNGDEDAVIELVNYYKNQKPQSPDKIEFVIELLEKEVIREHCKAMYVYANLYFEGDCVVKDNLKGFELLKKAADKGHPQAQTDIGKLYFEGGIVQRNYQLAVHYFSLAAEAKQVTAQYMMGVCCRDGYGTLVDYTKALNYFKASAERGCTQSYLALGKMYHDGTGGICNYQEAIHYYKLLANSNYTDAYLLISDIYLSDVAQAHIDYEKATYWLEQGTKRHNAECCHKLAILHINRKFKNSNIEKGLELLKEAAELGSAAALYEYAKMLIDGKYLSQNYAKAVLYLKKASHLNHVKASTLLAHLYITASGCDFNPILAADLFSTAARHGDSEAQFELAKLFKDGVGVPQSNFDAYIWSVLAVSTDANSKARKLRDEIAQTLSFSQLTQAQYIASDYFNQFLQ